jgi:hypothetical protein
MARLMVMARKETQLIKPYFKHNSVTEVPILRENMANFKD